MYSSTEQESKWAKSVGGVSKRELAKDVLSALCELRYDRTPQSDGVYADLQRGRRRWRRW